MHKANEQRARRSVGGSRRASLVPTAPNYLVATRDLALADAEVSPEAKRYARFLAAYRERNSDLAFLSKLSLAACSRRTKRVRPKSATFTSIACQLLTQCPARQFIKAVTRTTKEKGFEILHSWMRPTRVWASTLPKLPSIERKVSPTYGAIGEEAVYGAELVVLPAEARLLGRLLRSIFRHGNGSQRMSHR